MDVSGDVTVDGAAMSKAYFLENAAYVPQEDRLWSALTGDDHLYTLSTLSPQNKLSNMRALQGLHPLLICMYHSCFVACAGRNLPCIPDYSVVPRRERRAKPWLPGLTKLLCFLREESLRLSETRLCGSFVSPSKEGNRVHLWLRQWR